MQLRLLATALLPLYLCGCAVRQAKEAFARDKANCIATIPAKIGSYERLRTCIGAAMDNDLAPAFPNDAARIDQLASHSILLGQQIDQGKISPEQAHADMADFRAQVIAESQEAAAERQRAAAAMLTALHPYFQPTPIPSPIVPAYRMPITTNCTQMGTYTNCTSQ